MSQMAAQCAMCGQIVRDVLCQNCASIELPEEAAEKPIDPLLQLASDQGVIITTLLQHMQSIIDSVEEWDPWRLYQDKEYECSYCGSQSHSKERVQHLNDCALILARKLIKEHSEYLEPETYRPEHEDDERCRNCGEFFGPGIHVCH